MTEWLHTLANLMQESTWFAPLLAVVAGIVTSFSPCSLGSVPVVLACVGGTAGNNTKKAFRLSLVMAGGMAVTFMIFGSLASVIGHFMEGLGSWWFLLLGIVMLLMAIQTWGIYEFLPVRHFCGTNITKKGYIGAFLAGMLSGVFASHCAAPVMVALLALAAQSGRWLWSIFLMLLYAIGHSVLLLVAGTSYGAVEKALQNPRLKNAADIMRKILGAIIFLIGIGMLVFAWQHGQEAHLLHK